LCIAEPLPEILGPPSFYELKEGSNCHPMCMERKSRSARTKKSQDGNYLLPPGKHFLIHQ